MPEFAAQLSRRISDGSVVVGIYGLGYVGLPLALRFAEVGIKVIGFDIDQRKIDAITAGESYIRHIPSASVRNAVSRGFLTATTDFSKSVDADTLVICVPTPLGTHMEPDMTFVEGTIANIEPFLRRGHLISLESTTYPGTTEDIVVPALERAGLILGVDGFAVFSPEREDPGNPDFKTQTIPKVAGGHTDVCLQLGSDLYRKVIDRVVPVRSTRVAEMAKLLENIYRSVNIGLVNELKVVCDRMDVDIWEVIDAASTKPFGFKPFYPGPGLGGHCIPIDPFYLTWKAREYGVHTRFIELAGEVNNAMPEYVVSKVMEGLNQHSKALNGSRVLVLGLAYKKNVDDARESPTAELIKLLLERGAEVAFSDPHIPTFPLKRRYKYEMESVPLRPDTLESYDCVLLATDHDAFDYDLILKHAQLIVDARGRYRGDIDKVVRA
jgi:UDP-N-acetyl-D-glucosamine dehydrogenase